MKIYVVTHKDYTFPTDSIYCPIQVGGGTLKQEITRDNQGENIANFNSSFCELTALYWIWKNSVEDIVGLVHYRRYFSGYKKGISFLGKKIASQEDFLSILESSDIIVSKPRNYFIFTIRDHYIKAHYQDDLRELENIISENAPEYNDAFNYIMNSKKISLYNMFVCEKNVIDDYCSWLFPLLFRLEKNIHYKDYDSYQKRVFGFLGERLFNIWLYHNKGKYKQFHGSVINMEGENIFLKAIGLLKRHFLRK